MKYIICPIIILLFYLFQITLYIILQCIHLIWHLKLDEFIMDKICGGHYYCLSHRPSFNNNWFYPSHIYKLHVIPTSLFEYTKWVIKYGFYGEITELSKKENKKYSEFCKHNKPQVNKL